MKVTQNDTTGLATYTPETPAERKALEWHEEHTPLFAAASQYGIQAFIAGYEMGVKDDNKSKLKHAVRDIKSIIDSLDSSAGALDNAISNLTD